MHLLEFQNVTRETPPPSAGGAPQRVLDGIDLALAPDEIVALIGRSGAGKTTLLHLAAGLLRPTRGRILFAGADLALLPAPALNQLRRRRIALVFQNNLALSALPVWENAALPLQLDGVGAAEARRMAGAMLDQVGLAGLADAATGVLSGGQRRRLGLARALLADPELLLADEPTADLDETTGREIETLLFGWLREHRRAALIVTHAPSIERAADRVLRVEQGRLQPADPAA